MPNYASNPAPLLELGRGKLVWDVDTLANGDKSLAVNLAQFMSQHYPESASIEFAFSAAPGNFTFAIEVCDTDADANYCPLVVSGTAVTIAQTTLNSGGKNCRLEIPLFKARFMRLSCTAHPVNAVTTSAKIVR